MKESRARNQNKLPPLKVYGRQEFLQAIQEAAKKEGVSSSLLAKELIAKGIKHRGRV